MIIGFHGGALNSQHYLICLKRSVTEPQFLTAARAKPRSYAGEMLANLHDRIFHRSLELKRDYAKYYQAEYSTFAEYARKRLRIPPVVASAASALLPSSRQIIYYHPDLQFIRDEYGQEFLEKLLDPWRTK